MFDFINPLSYLIQIDLSKYLFAAFAVFGVMLLIKKLFFNRGV